MASKEDKLQEAIDGLEDIEGVEGAAVVRRDGLLIVSSFPEDTEVDQIAAMTASVVGSGETASETLSIGDVDQVTIEAEEGKLVSTGAGDEGILAVLTDPEINMGLLLVEMRKAAGNVERTL
ncbi:MAG: roadblock/LC7 domain-containing protein [Candidatus Nanohaloarchaea archaeon]|nr:roadblock/LC7 domain-containing protein [Candidatus Nanohaloarchaea archaeon]